MVSKNEFIHFAYIPDIRLTRIAFFVIAFDHFICGFFDDNLFGTFEIHSELSLHIASGHWIICVYTYADI